MKIKHCKQCQLEFIITRKDYRKQFCSHSCAAIFNNFKRDKINYKDKFCEICQARLEKYQKKFCSNKCQGQNNKLQLIKKLESGDSISPDTIRKYLFSTREHKCVICKNTDWCGTTIPLSMDHIDGNATNNKLENLRLICPNCDRLLPTFGSRNKGFGRQARGIKRYDKYDNPL